MLPGLAASVVVDRGPAKLIDRTAGTNIGDMTSGGGLAGAFDGVTNQGRSFCARKGSAAAQNGWVGKTFGVPTAIDSVTVFGSSDVGYVDNDPTVTITLYGKTGAAPASGTDGTSLGAITFADTGNESVGRLIASANVASYWAHVWVHLTQPANQGINIGELQMVGWQ
jgi:hypothetical protein